MTKKKKNLFEIYFLELRTSTEELDCRNFSQLILEHTHTLLTFTIRLQLQFPLNCRITVFIN